MSTPIIVLFGGTSSERRVSVASAQNVVSHLRESHPVEPWFWTPEGEILQVSQDNVLSHQRAFEMDFQPHEGKHLGPVESALDAVHGTDATFFLALHGRGSEDGTLQRLLEARSLAFTGSGARASALAFDKGSAKQAVSAAGGRTAPSRVVRGEQADIARVVAEALETFGSAVLKPLEDGSSHGLFFVENQADLDTALAHLADHPTLPYLLEAFVAGRELTVGVFQTKNGATPLPCTEIIVDTGRRFDYAGKYLGAGTQEITPADIAPDIAAAAQQLALTAHQTLGCYGYSRTDVIVDGDGPLFIEINTLPGITKASLYPQQLAAAGIYIGDFLESQVELARERLRRGAP